MQEDKEQMIKIVIISDTHGTNEVIDQVIERESPFDYLIHCGDAEANLKKYSDLSNPYEFFAVRGNCDFGNSLPTILNERISCYNVLITHGHRERVKYGDQDLVDFGIQNHADIILYGHTHIDRIVEDGGILLINPGSLTMPHGERHMKTYAVLTISDDYERHARIMDLL